MTPGTMQEMILGTEAGGQWRSACQALGVELPRDTGPLFDQLGRLYDLLVETNRHTNLTRITSPPDFLYRHVLDAWVLSPFIPAGHRVADVGSGAGFPALPLALLRPDLRITAIEATGKKCRFIEEAKAALGLENLTVVNERSETLGRKPEYRESFNTVTARAVAALPVLLELCIPLLEVDGLFLAPKGQKREEELKQAGKALHVLGTALEQSIEIPTEALPEEYAQPSYLLIFRKDRPTPPQYPRSAGMPAKKPL